MKLYHRLFIGLVLGLAGGLFFHQIGGGPLWLPDFSKTVLGSIGQIFLRLLFMIVVPMVFSALVIGVFEISKSQGMKKVAGKTLLYTLIASSISVLIGFALVNWVKPGSLIQLDTQALISQQSTAVETIKKNASQASSLSQTFVELVPKNPLDSAVRALEGQMLPFMLFALFFGIALGVTERKSKSKGNVLIDFLERVFETCVQMVEWILEIAPFAVFAIVFNTTYNFGFSVLGALSLYVVTVVVGLLIQQFVVYGLLLKWGARRAPLEFFRTCREVYLYAFSTASSNATLPRSLKLAESELKLSPKISRFVLTVGATANQNGTALFEGVTILFLAQVYQVDLSFLQQMQVIVMSIIAGIGTAGVPGGSLPVIAILLQSVGIPAEGLGIILGVDRFLDMCRTTLNVSGDLVIAALVDQSSHGVSTKA